MLPEIDRRETQDSQKQEHESQRERNFRGQPLAASLVFGVSNTSGLMEESSFGGVTKSMPMSACSAVPLPW